MNHTKGEWTHWGRKILDKDNNLICEMAGDVSETRVANARLIASAPDLYEACLSALGVMATLDQNKGWVKEISGVIQKALAKAEGK